MLLENKNAIIYGGSGSIGTATALTFAREGARVFLVGRTQETLDTAAQKVRDAGGQAEMAVIDVLDGPAVDEHAKAVAAEHGSVDVSFLLVARGDVQRIPLVDMTLDDLQRPVVNGIRSVFNTATSAARIMSEQGSGVILGLNSGSATASMPGMGGTGPADAAQETFLRYLAAECGPKGVRVLNIYTAGVQETFTQAKLDDVADGWTPEEAIEMISGMSVLGRAPRLAEVSETATFLASDRASGMTGVSVNVTSGLILGR
jgi:NAD(P)-dependent dehydrogenase (short-subunit alcohol dehydrogenase family)